MKLPPGFPVKVDIPVLPTVSARVTFHDFAWKNTNSKPPIKKSSTLSVNGGQASNGNVSGSDESCGEGERGGSARRKSIRSLKDEEDPSEKIVKDDDILPDELFDIPKDYVEVRSLH